MIFNTIDDVYAFLAKIPNFQHHGNTAYHPGLDTIRSFCEQIGNPQLKFKSIHVAGTNGKGTTCAILTSLFVEHGYKTATYISPHLLHLNERFRINGLACSDEDILLFFKQYEEVILNSPLSYFELLTACSFSIFAHQNVDIAIIEVGLGGRLDATNIISPLCSVITSIGFDHKAILGNTLAEIAFEKAGIIKQDIPVVIGDLPKEAMLSIEKKAQELNAKMIYLNDSSIIEQSLNTFYTDSIPKDLVELDLPGLINFKNATICLLILNEIANHFTFDTFKILQALKHVRQFGITKGRFEKLDSRREWYFDGAHNEEAIYWLKYLLKKKTDLKNVTCICTFMKDKDITSILSEYSSFKMVYFYNLKTQRAASFSDISTFSTNCVELTDEMLKNVLTDLKNDIVIFTGSFYFYQIVDSWLSHS